VESVRISLNVSFSDWALAIDYYVIARTDAWAAFHGRDMSHVIRNGYDVVGCELLVGPL